MCSSPVSRSSRRGALALLAATALLLVGCSADPGSGGDPSRSSMPGTEALRQIVEPILAEHRVPGAAVSVSPAEGSATVLLTGEAAAATAVVPETRFAYRSITKSFVGTVILQLVDEGRIALTDPVSAYVAGVPGGEEITIEQLGAMRSGLANYSALPEFGELLSADPGADPDPDELLAFAFAASPEFPPGSAYEYSNTNTLLLGKIIEAVTDDSWEAAVHERIIDPLDAVSIASGFTDTGPNAIGFQLVDGTPPEELPTVAAGWFGAAGALTGDIVDLTTWGRALGSGALLSPEAQAARLDALGPTRADPASPRYDRYGFAIGEIDGWIGHTGNGLGFQSLVMFDPESSAVVAILVNGTGEDPDLPATIFDAVATIL